MGFTNGYINYNSRISNNTLYLSNENESLNMRKMNDNYFVDLVVDQVINGTLKNTQGDATDNNAETELKSIFDIK